VLQFAQELQFIVVVVEDVVLEEVVVEEDVVVVPEDELQTQTSGKEHS
jgi:hypothetical protein